MPQFTEIKGSVTLHTQGVHSFSPLYVMKEDDRVGVYARIGAGKFVRIKQWGKTSKDKTFWHNLELNEGKGAYIHWFLDNGYLADKKKGKT